jgi:hypothetical protein
MGAKLVGQAFAFAARYPLTPSETLLLVWMAQTALDADLPPRYFAAREHSAIALGRLVPDAPDPSAPDAAAVLRERAAAFQRVKLATQGLVRARAIVSVRRGREGQRAEYILTFGAVETGDSAGTESVPLAGTESVPLSGSKSVLQPVPNPYPQGATQEPPRLTRRETPVPAAPHVRPVERSEAA